MQCCCRKHSGCGCRPVLLLSLQLLTEWLEAEANDASVCVDGQAVCNLNELFSQLLSDSSHDIFWVLEELRKWCSAGESSMCIKEFTKLEREIRSVFISLYPGLRIFILVIWTCISLRCVMQTLHKAHQEGSGEQQGELGERPAALGGRWGLRGSGGCCSWPLNLS